MLGTTYADRFIVDDAYYNSGRISSKSSTPIDYIRLSPAIVTNKVVGSTRVYYDLKRRGFPPLMVWKQVKKCSESEDPRKCILNIRLKYGLGGSDVWFLAYYFEGDDGIEWLRTLLHTRKVFRNRSRKYIGSAVVKKIEPLIVEDLRKCYENSPKGKLWECYMGVADKYNISKERVHRLLKKYGMIRRKQGGYRMYVDDYIVSRVKELRKKGMSYKKISDELRKEGINISEATVYRIVRKYGWA